MQYARTAIWIMGVIFVIGAVLIIASSVRGIFGNPRYEIRVSGADVTRELRGLDRLETASFTIEKIIDAGTSGSAFSEWLLGDRILLIAHGDVIAGFDLSKLDEGAIAIDGTRATLDLPAPQVLVTRLDNDETRVYDRRTGLLTRSDKDLEAQARAAAESAIKASACTNGILKEATTNARKELTALLQALGFATVIINIPEGTCR